MKLLNIFKRFTKDESGAVTVDFVVLTGAIVAMAIVVGSSLGGSIQSRASSVSSQISGTPSN